MVIAIEFKDISPAIPLTKDIVNKAKSLVKKFYKFVITLNANNIEYDYELRGFVLFEYPNHFKSYIIKNMNNIANSISTLYSDDENYGSIKEVEIDSVDNLFETGYIQTLIYEKNN